MGERPQSNRAGVDERSERRQLVPSESELAEPRQQLLHGEPHPGNVLGTKSGLLFIDLETITTWRWTCSAPSFTGIYLFQSFNPGPAIGTINSVTEGSQRR